MKGRSRPLHIHRRAFLRGSTAAGASAGVHAVTSSLGNDPATGPINNTAAHAAPTIIHHAPAAIDGDAPNPIVAENRMPGTPGWGFTQLLGDIEGYASETSVVAGDTLTFFVNTRANTFDVLIYRIGYYGGIGARVLAEVRGLPGVAQPVPTRDDDTGFASCARWSPSHQLAVPDTWVSGIYIVKLVRPDTGGEACIYLTVREGEAARQLRDGRGDSRGSDVLFQQSVTTYQAYNPHGGKSLYHFNSSTCQTVSAGPRAVKVSFDRPYAHPLLGQNHFFLSDFPVVYWLEAQGYDVSYCTSIDTHRSGQPNAANRLLNHRIFLSVGHDEYWSQEMRDAVRAARDGGVHLAFLSSNTSYWRVRLEPDPHTGRPDRVLCCYKSAESGVVDPISPTSTWRDPAINQPENSLVGVQYIGDNDMRFFPIRVSAQQGQDRLYRHTPLANMQTAYTDLGHRLVGWEWDAVTDNGFGPERLTVLAATPTYGNVLDDAGRRYRTGTGVAHVVRYIATSGATVFAAGTNQWGWGLAVFDPDPRVQQVMANLLADMGALPATPASTLVLDAPVAAASQHNYDDGTDAKLDFVRAAPHAKFGSGDVGSPQAKAAQARAAAQPSVADPVISNLILTANRTAITASFSTDVDTVGQIWVRIAPTRSDYRLSADLDWRLPTAALGVSEPHAQSHVLTQGVLEAGRPYYVTLVAVDRSLRVTVLAEQRIETAPGNAFDLLRDGARTLARALPCWVRQNGPVAVGLLTLAATSGLVWRLRRVRRKRGDTPGH